MKFSEIVGHQTLKQALGNSAAEGTLAHALIFSGAEGSANVEFCLALAQYLCCENKIENDSCGKCAGCIKASKLSHPDIFLSFPVTATSSGDEQAIGELTKDFREQILANPYLTPVEWAASIGADNKVLSIGGAEARKIIKWLSFKPYEAKFKIVLVWLPELMRTEAANAMLKTLEEPNGRTVFIMMSNQPGKLLATIISRTQTFNVRPYTKDEVVSLLTSKHQISDENARKVAQISSGNMVKANALLHESASEFLPMFQQWMRNCFARKFGELLLMSEQFNTMGRELQKAYFQFTLEIILQSIRSSAGVPIGMSNQEEEFISKFSKYITIDNIDLIYNELTEGSYHLERNGNGKMIFFDISLQLAGIFQQRTK